jgi:hypothetical protein
MPDHTTSEPIDQPAVDPMADPVLDTGFHTGFHTGLHTGSDTDVDTAVEPAAMRRPDPVTVPMPVAQAGVGAPVREAVEGAQADASAAPAQAKKPASPRRQLLKSIGGLIVAFAVVVGFRALTADDGTHGIKVGECVAPQGSDDFKKVDCTAPDAVGTVTFIDTSTATDTAAVRDLCAKHGAASAFTSAEVENGDGTVVCVADR